MQWKLITDVILISAFATFAVFVMIGICQLFKRKSLRKVDRELLWAILPLALMTITYVVFDKFWVLNVRPDGSGEPSFPSTHAMVVATIFLMAAIILPKYVKSKSACAVLDLMMLLLLFLVCVGRVFAGMHWISDVLGGLGFALIFVTIYYLIIRRKKNG